MTRIPARGWAPEAHTPMVSVIMAVYNSERFVQKAIESVLAQSWADFELIVVDDASTDGTPAILANLADPRVVILTSEKNLGPYGAANRGLAVARGELVARLDADDVSLPQRLEKQVQQFRERPALVLLGSGYHLIDEQGRILETVALPTTDAELQRRLEFGNLLVHSTIMVRRRALDAVGGYRTFRVSQDYDMYLRVAELGEIATLEEPLVLFRFHGKSISRNKKELQLAYRRLAWTLAEQRRATGVEGPIPEDVLSAYPPEPNRLFQDARGTAYLFYATDRPDLAQEALSRAQYLLPQVQETTESWEEWSLGRATHHAALHKDAEAGAEFLRCMAEWLGPALAGGDVDRLLGRFYAEQAFLSQQAGGNQHTLANVWRAIRCDPRWLGNRGLWAISARSLSKTRTRGLA